MGLCVTTEMWWVGSLFHISTRHQQHYPPGTGNGHGCSGLDELAAGVEGLKVSPSGGGVDGGALEGEEEGEEARESEDGALD